MVSHKPFIQWQWFDCKKPLEKPLIQMVEIWKTIEKTIDTNDSHVKKPLKNHWYQWFTCKKNHWKTIDYNGTLAKNINHSIVVKILPSLSSMLLSQGWAEGWLFGALVFDVSKADVRGCWLWQHKGFWIFSSLKWALDLYFSVAPQRPKCCPSWLFLLWCHCTQSSCYFGIKNV